MRQSLVWEHAKKIKDNNGKMIAKCNHCGESVPALNGSTNGISNHLSAIHQIHVEALPSNKRKRSSSPDSGDDLLAFLEFDPTDRLAIIWSKKQLPFKLIDDPEFRAHFGEALSLIHI